VAYEGAMSRSSYEGDRTTYIECVADGRATADCVSTATAISAGTNFPLFGKETCRFHSSFHEGAAFAPSKSVLPVT
jgi:hypothetical protein